MTERDPDDVAAYDELATGCARTPPTELYAAAKRELATRDWKYVQQYANAKSDVVGEIMSRAEAAASS